MYMATLIMNIDGKQGNALSVCVSLFESECVFGLFLLTHACYYEYMR